MTWKTLRVEFRENCLTYKDKCIPQRINLDERYREIFLLNWTNGSDGDPVHITHTDEIQHIREDTIFTNDLFNQISHLQVL